MVSLALHVRKHWKIAVPILVFSIVYFGFHPGRLASTYVRGDERVSLNVALDLVEYSATNGPYNVTGWDYQTGEGGFWAHPPLYYILISPIASSAPASRLFSLFLAFVNLVLVYVLTEKHFGFGGYVSATGMALIPSMVIRGDVVTMDMLLLTFVLSTLILNETQNRWGVLIMVALGINTKYTFGLVLLPLALGDRRLLIESVLVMALALLPFGFWSWVRTGDVLMLRAWMNTSPAWYTYYPTPGKHMILLILLSGLGLIRRRLGRRELPFLLLVTANLVQFYSTPMRRFYYLLPSYALLASMVGAFVVLETKALLEWRWPEAAEKINKILF